jgi:hypothetical protein
LIFFLENKKQDFFVKRLEQIMSRLVKKVFKNDIILLVKIQIYSNIFFRKIKNQKNCKKTRTNSEQISEEIFQK